MNERRITFKSHQTNVAKYISFFAAINARTDPNDELYKYERCTLLIVDFKHKRPILYRTTTQLIEAGQLPKGFSLPLESLSFDTFTKDILASYAQRFNLNNLKI